jgi:hypothetical protein
MPCCPKCREEFQDWVKVCPDCGASLIERPPTPPESLPKPISPEIHNEPLVYIATAPNGMLANMWSDILLDNGIRCLLKGGNLGAAWYISPNVLSYELHVLAPDADKAKQILETLTEQ